MGRTQNVINFTAIVLQLVLTMAAGWLCQHIGLVSGFYAVASFYLVAGLLGVVVAQMPASGAKLEPPPAPSRRSPPPDSPAVQEILMPQVEAAEL